MAFSSGGDNDEVMSEINITPMVDVMLVLLVVFIITAPMLTNSIKVNLPKTAETPVLSEPKPPLVLSIDAAGKLYLDKTEMGLEFLQRSLEQRKAADPELVLQLNADEAVNYGTVAKTMVLIEKAGIDRLSVITEKQ
ncbi:biopolymer transporter ExbD [Rheinheimera texasensis]|uniref:ExbD/TolR family protein n=1 Tax=Rheinheimera texasensis TaxID=306205 RepID=UPI0032B1F9A0